MTEYERNKDAFTAQGANVTAMIAPLSAEQWEAPSTLPGWTVKVLVVHIMYHPRFLATYHAGLAKQPHMREAYQTRPLVEDRFSRWRIDGAAPASFWRDYYIRAARLIDLDQLVPKFTQMMVDARFALDNLPATHVLKAQRGGILLGESIVYDVMELTIHTLDLARSLGEIPRFAHAARAVTIQTLEVLLEQPRSDDVADDVAFIAKATGRARPGDLGIPAFNPTHDG